MFDRKKRQGVGGLDDKAAVGILAALMSPVFIGVLGLGIDVSYWELTKVELQRAADVAALAGAAIYAETNNNGASAIAAAQVAELNGGSGATTRGWNVSTQVLSDNQVSVALVAGVRHANDTAVQASVTRSVPVVFAQMFTNKSNESIQAVGTAEVGTPRGAQPCVLALAGDGTGVTTGTDISLIGNSSIMLANCTLRSDASITIGGSASVSVPAGIYAAGTISVSGNGQVNGSPEHQNSGQIPDPYAHDPAMQQALAQLGSGGQMQPATSTLGPGTYASLDFKGSVNLLAGLYVVNGPISFEANASVSGTGVTLVSSGSVTMNGRAVINLSAPGPDASGGAVPGILYANTSAGQTIQWNGASTENLTGVFYTPNSTLKINGNAAAGSNGCLEAIAANVNILGSATLAANCASLGALPFGSMPGAVALVE